MWNRLSRMSRRVRSGGPGRSHSDQRPKNGISQSYAEEKVPKPRFPSPKSQPKSCNYKADPDDGDDYVNTADLNIYGNLWKKEIYFQRMSLWSKQITNLTTLIMIKANLAIANLLCIGTVVMSSIKQNIITLVIWLYYTESMKLYYTMYYNDHWQACNMPQWDSIKLVDAKGNN